MQKKLSRFFCNSRGSAHAWEHFPLPVTMLECWISCLRIFLDGFGRGENSTRSSLFWLPRYSVRQILFHGYSDSSIRASRCRAWLRDGCYLHQWSHLVRKNWGVLALLRKVMSAWTRKNAMREVKELTKENRQVLLPMFAFAADWTLCARDFSGLSTKALLHIQQYTDLLEFRSFLSRQAPVHMSALFL